MKLLDKTIFKRKNVEIKDLEAILADTSRHLKTALEKKRGLEAEVEDLNEIVADLSTKLCAETADKRKYSGKCGGLTKQVNKLLAENSAIKTQYEKLSAEYDAFRENKYVVRVIKPEKKPRGQVMRVKNAQKTSNIIARVKEIDKMDE